MFRYSTYLLLFILLSFKSVQAQQTTRILFIYDASNSMNGFWKTKQKHQIARTMLTDMVDSLSHIDNLQLALRAFGHQKNFPPQDCDDTRLEVGFADDNHMQIKKALERISARGTTPIAMTLEESAHDFTPCDDCRNVIILITDGIEECDGDPCAVSYMLQQKGIVLKPFILGINIDERFKKTYDCVGNFYDVSSEQEFEQVLGIVVSQALNNTTVQVNLLDQNQKPNETNVAMTFYNRFSGAPLYNFVHTMNARGLPDTIPIDPALSYDLVVHTLPSVKKDSITFEPGRHNTVAVDAPQGHLDFPIFPNSLLQGKQAIVKKKGSCEIINVQPLGEQTKYLVGAYDLEINTLPRTYINDVRVSQSHTTDIKIPEPGVAHLNMDAHGYGTILQEKKGKLKWVCTLPDNITKKSVYLQPGNYRFIYRNKSASESVFTFEKKFKIKAGLSTTVNVY